MKNFTNNFKQFTSRLSARWLIMALMMLVGTSSAWAEMWINDTNGWNIEIERNGVSSWLGGDNGFSREDKDGAYEDYSTSNSTSLTIKNAWVKASSNDGWQIRYVTLYYRVSTNQTGNFTQLKCKDLGNSITNASSSYFELSNINKSIIDGLSGGTYYLDYYFTVGNDGCDKGYSYAPEYNCNGNNPHPSRSGAQNCSYYSIKFKVPEQEKKYSLGGYINGGDKSYNTDYELTKQTDGTYTGTFSNFISGTQYFQVFDDLGTKWGVNSYTPLTVGSSVTLNNANNGEKVGISLTKETSYVFTFNPSDGNFSVKLSCTKPDAPEIDESDTTCPNVNYTLPTATNKGTYTQKWYDSNETEVTSPVKVSTQTTYTTKLIDGTCESDATEFTLYVTSKPTAPEIEAANNQICEGDGTATISIQEYSSEYTYALYNEGTLVANPNFNSETGEFTISVAGKYKVTATESTCTLESDKSNEVSINYYTAPVIDEDTYSVTNETSCNQNNNNDGIISLNPTIGVSYSLSKDEITYVLEENKWSNLTAGTYTLTATLDACQKLSNTKEITVGLTDNTAIKIDISITADKNPICYGTKAKLTCTEISDASYLWNTKETTSEITTENLTSNTTFSVKVSNTENGCTTTKETSITINVNSDVLKPNLTEESTSICSGSSVNLGEFAPEGTVWYENQACTEPLETTVAPTDHKTYYAKAKDGECLSSEYTELTINVTTTPVITGPSATQPNKEITLSSAAGANTKWETSSGSTLTPANGAETVFTATGNGNYTITAKNTANNITCSATHEIVVNDKFYIYIRRPKSGTTTYDQWYEKTNDADKGAHPWMKNGSEYKTGDDYTNNNYDGYGPESTFTDCNGYVWDAFIAPGTSFFIHAPNTFQEGGQVGYATFTQVTNITSTATDLYYTINQWAGRTTKGTTLSPASEPNRIPEVAVPVLSIDPVSGIICQGAEATITVTNPENGVSYKLNYEGKDQTNSIAYTGTGNVEFAVTEAGTYLVKAETTSGTCKGNAISIAREIQVITTSIAFVGAPYVTTPWEPITITVNIPKGYNYTFNDTQLTQIASPDTPIKKVSGSEYTYSFPRPQEWGTGNSQTGDSWGEKSYTISATLNGVTESCGTTTATVKLQDEGNDNCNP